ncbi:MAG TPA: hypothetical protein VHG29_10455 [Novosphingobium sp.]|nr:hypothetical protein [Novosphingobium sp.]
MDGRIPLPPRSIRYPAMAAALARDAFGREIAAPGAGSSQPDASQPALDPTNSSAPKEKATDALGRRAGALMDEIAFPAFVASLLHGTYDAIVDSSIKQVEGFAELVSAVAKPLDQFASENVTTGQVRAWLVEQYPQDVTLVEDRGSYTLAALRHPDDEDDAPSPAWLADFGAEGEALTAELLEERVLPAARTKVAQNRLSTLSTMVLLGMQRVVVKDGTVSAALKFRASAADRAAVQYATSNDPQTGGTQWGARGSEGAITTVSTVAVNAQTDSELKAEVTGNVRINFASETLPLDRFVDEAQRTLLERHSRRTAPVAQGTPSALPPAVVAAPVAAAPIPAAPAAIVAPPVPAVAGAPR